MKRRSPSSLDPYLADLAKIPLLSAAEEKEIAARVQSGDRKAHEHLVRANLRLVVSIAKHFRGRGIPIEDLIAEGNIGLMRAAELFKPDRETRFSTYAAFWIKKNIRKLIYAQGHSIAIPNYMVVRLAKWRRVQARLRAELQREPTPEQIGAELDLKPKHVRAVLQALRVTGELAVDIEHVDSGDRLAAIDTIPGNEPDPADAAEHTEDIEWLKRAMWRLDERTRGVLRKRARGVTLAEIGDELGVMRERVRQIEEAAIDKLRALVSA